MLVFERCLEIQCPPFLKMLGYTHIFKRPEFWPQCAEGLRLELKLIIVSFVTIN